MTKILKKINQRRENPRKAVPKGVQKGQKKGILMDMEGHEEEKKVSKINVQPQIAEVRLEDLKPAPYNPREITGEALAGLRHSLEKFGYVDLLVVNKRTMHIISGHQRYKILQTDGVENLRFSR